MDARKLSEAYRRMISSPNGEIVMKDLLDRYVLHSPPRMTPEATVATRQLVMEMFEVAKVTPNHYTQDILEENN